MCFIPPMGMSEFRELFAAASVSSTGSYNLRRVSEGVMVKFPKIKTIFLSHLTILRKSVNLQVDKLLFKTFHYCLVSFRLFLIKKRNNNSEGSLLSICFANVNRLCGRKT